MDLVTKIVEELWTVQGSSTALLAIFGIRAMLQGEARAKEDSKRVNELHDASLAAQLKAVEVQGKAVEVQAATAKALEALADEVKDIRQDLATSRRRA